MLPFPPDIWSVHVIRVRAAAAASAAVAAGGVLGAAALISLPGTALADPAPASPASCPARVALTNGGFEKPTVASGFALLPDASTGQANAVPGWRTTATDHQIEIWHTGFNGVPAAEGTQFAELNANQVSALFQDVATTPGSVLHWRLSHRGRQGVDTMALDIGTPGALVQQRTFSDGNTAWGNYSGTYTVPAGQTTTRFSFRSVSAAGGNQGIGNFLDGISFGTPPCVLLSKEVVPAGQVFVGDKVTYRVTARNDGGSEAQALALADAIPTGTTYVPGSLHVTAGANAGVKTDRPNDDQADYDSRGNRVVFRLGTGASAAAGGRLGVGESTTVEFQVRVNSTSSGGQISNTATATYTNPLSTPAGQLTSSSEEVVNPVAPCGC